MELVRQLLIRNLQLRLIIQEERDLLTQSSLSRPLVLARYAIVI